MKMQKNQKNSILNSLPKLWLTSLLICGAISVGGCTAQDLSTTGVNQVSLERDYQNVIHTDCSGNVVSQGIETVASPTQWVTITPTHSADTYTWTINDTETNSSPSFLSGYYTFQVDYSYGALNMHVISGTNTINYSFSNCTAWTTDAHGNQICEASVVGETGTVTINVSYTEKTLPGSVTESDCNPTPSPTPSSQVVSHQLVKH